jgi:hypothetical protein
MEFKPGVKRRARIVHLSAPMMANQLRNLVTPQRRQAAPLSPERAGQLTKDASVNTDRPNRSVPLAEILGKGSINGAQIGCQPFHASVGMPRILHESCAGIRPVHNSLHIQSVNTKGTSQENSQPLRRSGSRIIPTSSRHESTSALDNLVSAARHLGVCVFSG